MAKIYDIKKDGATVYPRTVSDAVAVVGGTLTDVLAKKADKTEIDSIADIANMAYGEASVKQPMLESGKNIKTVGGESLVGEGDVAVVKGLISAVGKFKYLPNSEGYIDVTYAPLGGVIANGNFLEPNENGTVTIPASAGGISSITANGNAFTPNDSGNVDLGGLVTQIMTEGGESFAPQGGTIMLPTYAKGITLNGNVAAPDQYGSLVINAVTDVNVNGASVVNNGVADISISEVKEWVGTQAEFDKLTEFDEKTTYYIYD